MKRCSLLCAGVWPFIFLPLLLLLPLLLFKWHDIEDDVAGNAQSDLAAVGADWAIIETTNRGRDILITGIPPNEASIGLAKEKAARSYGVNRVDVSSDVKPVLIPPIEAELDIIIAGDTLVLRGTLANQGSIKSIVDQAETVFPAANISNRLRVDSNISALPNLKGIFANLSDKSFWKETLIASLKGNQLSLRGTLDSRESNAMLVTQMTNGLGLDVSNNMTVAAAPIKLRLCQDLIDKLLSERNISFVSGGATIQQQSLVLLEDIKSATSHCPDANYEVSGNTDSTGNLNFNISLSGLRAQSVVDHLVGLGLNAAKFTVVSNGPNKPIADNSTAEGRAKNRRIEFTVKN